MRLFEMAGVTMIGIDKKVLLILIFLFTFFTQHKVLFADVSTPSVTVVPDSSNFYADYDISTTTGNGDTQLDPPSDSIFVLFDSTTVVPATINPSYVTINSTAVNAVVISGQRLAIPTPVPIAKNAGSIFISIS